LGGEGAWWIPSWTRNIHKTHTHAGGMRLPTTTTTRGEKAATLYNSCHQTMKCVRRPVCVCQPAERGASVCALGAAVAIHFRDRDAPSSRERAQNRQTQQSSSQRSRGLGADNRRPNCVLLAALLTGDRVNETTSKFTVTFLYTASEFLTPIYISELCLHFERTEW